MLRRCRRHHFWFASLLFSFPNTQFYFYTPEHKHGHPDKLFQYCSTDIDSLVQRQIRVRFQNIFHIYISPHRPIQFDGERDLRTPHDFAGSANLSRLDDLGEDDDEADADDSPTASYTRHDGIKSKNIPDGGKQSGVKPKTTSEVRPAFRLLPPLLYSSVPPRSTTASTSQGPYLHPHRPSLSPPTGTLTPPATA